MVNRRKKIKAKTFSIANKLFPIVKTATPVVAFLEQISAKDRQTLGSSFTQAGTMTQVKIMANIVTGRLAGFGLFHGNGLDNTIPPQTMNPSGIFNKWTTGGVLGILYGAVGGAVNKTSTKMGLGALLPATSKLRQLGKGSLAGGIIGGFFDDPIDSGQTSHNTHQNFPNLRVASAPRLQLSSGSGFRATSLNDPTVSGMS